MQHIRQKQKADLDTRHSSSDTDGTLHGVIKSTDCEDITENNYTTDNSNTPDKIEVNMLDPENNLSPG
jgi:ribosomal protein L33